MSSPYGNILAVAVVPWADSDGGKRKMGDASTKRKNIKP